MPTLGVRSLPFSRSSYKNPSLPKRVKAHGWQHSQNVGSDLATTSGKFDFKIESLKLIHYLFGKHMLKLPLYYYNINNNNIFGKPPKFHHIFCNVPIKMVHCKKDKRNEKHGFVRHPSPLINSKMNEVLKINR